MISHARDIAAVAALVISIGFLLLLGNFVAWTPASFEDVAVFGALDASVPLMILTFVAALISLPVSVIVGRRNVALAYCGGALLLLAVLFWARFFWDLLRL